MAATGFTPISLYYTTTAAAQPVDTKLVAGELALNTTDGKLYFKNTGGIVTLLASADGSIGNVVGPASATNNALARFDLTTGKLIKNSVAILTDAGALSGLTGLSTTSVTDSGLTSGRVTYAGTAGLLQDSANLTFNGTTLTSTGFAGPISGVVTSTSITDSGLTSGRVTYATTGGLLTDSANLTFNGTTLTLANDASISGLTVGKGGGAVATNTAIGASALVSNTSGAYNSVFGYQAGTAVTTGAYNCLIGGNAGLAMTTGVVNTFVGGVNCGSLVTTGSKNTILGGYNGNQGGLDIRTASNNIVLSDGDGNPRMYYSPAHAGWVFPQASAISTPINTSGVAGDTLYQAVLITKFDNNTTTSQNFIQFQVNNGVVNSGRITANGANAATFTSTSDSRLKENIVDLPSQLSNICALRPVEFDYIESEGGGHQIGFIAQEMQAVYPDVVNEQEDGMLAISGWSKTEARLIKAIQELNAKLEAQALEIATLKGK